MGSRIGLLLFVLLSSLAGADGPSSAWIDANKWVMETNLKAEEIRRTSAWLKAVYKEDPRDLTCLFRIKPVTTSTYPKHTNYIHYKKNQKSEDQYAWYESQTFKLAGISGEGFKSEISKRLKAQNKKSIRIRVHIEKMDKIISRNDWMEYFQTIPYLIDGKDPISADANRIIDSSPANDLEATLLFFELKPQFEYTYDEIITQCKKKAPAIADCAPSSEGPLGSINGQTVSKLNDAVSASTDRFSCKVTCGTDTATLFSVMPGKQIYKAGFCGLHALFIKMDDDKPRYSVQVTPKANEKGVQYATQEETVDLENIIERQKNFAEVSVSCEKTQNEL